MRDSINYNMLPIVEDNINCISGFQSYSITANGYYGFHPAPMQETKKEEKANNEVAMEVFEFEQETRRCNDEIHRLINRKRPWEQPDEHREFKKRRQNESSPFLQQQSPNVKLRKPTHNIPDMPRCLMENNVDVKKKVANTKDSELIEELLKETHGCSVYHWFSDDL